MKLDHEMICCCYPSRVVQLSDTPGIFLHTTSAKVCPHSANGGVLPFGLGPNNLESKDFLVPIGGFLKVALNHPFQKDLPVQIIHFRDPPFMEIFNDPSLETTYGFTCMLKNA